MRIDLPDPDYVSSKRSKYNFLLAFRYAGLLTIFIWLVFAADWLFHLDLIRFGVIPRQSTGLWGVFTTPFLHASWQHLLSNTMPLLVGSTAILYLYPNSSIRVIPIIYLGSSLVVWLVGRPDIHIGASGLIYGLLAYVFVAGLLRRDARSIAVSLLIWFLYSSLLQGLAPGNGRISWELHLAGFVLGLTLAVIYRRWDITPAKRYIWEDEDEDDHDSRTDADFPNHH